VLEQLYSDPSTSSIPAIMVTAKGQEHAIKQATDSGALGYICKPWENGEVEAMVLGALETIGQG